MSSYTLFIVLVTIYYHHIAVLCFSYHVIYHIHFICVYLSFAFMFHACINLRSGSVNTDISVIGFYGNIGNIGNIGKISVDIFTKISVIKFFLYFNYIDYEK